MPKEENKPQILNHDLSKAPKIDSVEILELIGQGGMALIYKAKQSVLDRVVAVKVLSDDVIANESRKKRFQLEAQLSSSLTHPNIVRTLGYGISTDGKPYLIMEYVQGISLEQEIAQNAPLTFNRFQEIFIPILSALQHAHEQGIVHRDIKPANIISCEAENGGTTVKLLDFGIAKLLLDEERSGSQKLTVSGDLIGSPSYMSPEQCRGESLDARSDIYSLCCVMYETLASEVPFSGNSPMETMQKHINEPPPEVSVFSRKMQTPDRLAATIIGGMAKSPEERPQSAALLAQKLRDVLAEITLDKAPRPQSRSKSSPRVVLFIALTSILILAAGIFSAQTVNHENKSAVKQKKTDQRSARIERALQLVNLAKKDKAGKRFPQAVANIRQALLQLQHSYPVTDEETAAQDFSVVNAASEVLKGMPITTSFLDSDILQDIMDNDEHVWSEEELLRFRIARLRIAAHFHCLYYQLNHLSLACDGPPGRIKDFSAEEFLAELKSSQIPLDLATNPGRHEALIFAICDGYVAAAKGNIAEAKKQLQTCRQLVNSNGDIMDSANLAKSYYEMGQLEKSIGEFAISEDDLRKSIAIAEPFLTEHPEGYMNASHALADLLSALHRFDESEKLLKQMRQKAEEHHLLNLIKTIDFKLKLSNEQRKTATPH